MIHIHGGLSLTEAGWELAQLIARIAGGESSKPEVLGHCEYFITYKHQDTPPLTTGCRA